MSPHDSIPVWNERTQNMCVRVTHTTWHPISSTALSSFQYFHLWPISFSCTRLPTSDRICSAPPHLPTADVLTWALLCILTGAVFKDGGSLAKIIEDHGPPPRNRSYWKTAHFYIPIKFILYPRAFQKCKKSYTAIKHQS